MKYVLQKLLVCGKFKVPWQFSQKCLTRGSLQVVAFPQTLNFQIYGKTLTPDGLEKFFVLKVVLNHKHKSQTIITLYGHTWDTSPINITSLLWDLWTDMTTFCVYKMVACRRPWLFVILSSFLKTMTKWDILWIYPIRYLTWLKEQKSSDVSVNECVFTAAKMKC